MKKTPVFIVLAIILLAIIYLIISSRPEQAEEGVEPTNLIETTQLDSVVTEPGLELIDPTPPLPPAPELDPSEPTWKTPAGQEGSEGFWIQ